MFTNKQKTRVMNAVSGYGFYETKQVKFQSPKNWSDVDRRIGRINVLLKEIAKIESHKYIARVTMMETIKEDVLDEIYDTFDTLSSIKKVTVSEMVNALEDCQTEVDFTSQQVYVNYLSDKLFNKDYEHYSLLDKIRTYW
jgi:hypothetical protein